MKLREFLDEVRFGNTARLCVAIKGDYDFLDNYEEGKYWELPAGNWEDGSESEACPAIPEEIMEAEVDEIDASPNLQTVYRKLGSLHGNSLDTTVIMVKAWDFDAEAYWTEDKLNEPVADLDCVCGNEWVYHISREKYREIYGMGDIRTVSTAVCCLPYIGIDAIKCYEEEDFAEMNEYEAEIYRMAQKIAPKIENLKEMLSLIQLFQEVNAFKI